GCGVSAVEKYSANVSMGQAGIQKEPKPTPVVPLDCGFELSLPGLFASGDILGTALAALLIPPALPTDEETYEQNNLPYSMYQLQTKLCTQEEKVIRVQSQTMNFSSRLGAESPGDVERSEDQEWGRKGERAWWWRDLRQKAGKEKDEAHRSQKEWEGFQVRRLNSGRHEGFVKARHYGFQSALNQHWSPSVHLDTWKGWPCMEGADAHFAESSGRQFAMVLFNVPEKRRTMSFKLRVRLPNDQDGIDL
ncbi:hypothetical protein MJT46_009728, partial [Ovis ammon polii x Ovis aries]